MQATDLELPPPGPESVTWRHVGQNPGSFLAGIGPLLQVAHPVVGAVVGVEVPGSRAMLRERRASRGETGHSRARY